MSVLGNRAPNRLTKFRTHWTVEEAAGALSAVAVWAVLIVTTGDTISRYFFNSPLNFAMDFGQMLMVIIVFLALASLNQVKGHIRVQFFVRRFPHKVQHAMAFLSSLIGIFAFGFIAWRAWVWTVEAWQGNYTYGGHVQLQIPECIPYGAIAVGSFLLCWSLFFDAVSSIRNLGLPSFRTRPPRRTGC